MNETSVLPQPDQDSEMAAVLRGQVQTLAAQIDGFREQLRDIYEMLGVNTHQDAEICIEMLQESVGFARELAHVYTRNPQDSASIVAALLVLIDSVGD